MRQVLPSGYVPPEILQLTRRPFDLPAPLVSASMPFRHSTRRLIPTVDRWTYRLDSRILRTLLQLLAVCGSVIESDASHHIAGAPAARGKKQNGSGWESNPPGDFSAATTGLKPAAVTRSAYTPNRNRIPGRPVLKAGGMNRGFVWRGTQKELSECSRVPMMLIAAAQTRPTIDARPVSGRIQSRTSLESSHGSRGCRLATCQ